MRWEPGKCIVFVFVLALCVVKLPPDTFVLALAQSVFTMSPVSSHTLCLLLTKPASAASLSASTTPVDTHTSEEQHH